MACSHSPSTASTRLSLSSAPASSRRSSSAWKNCHSSKAALSRRVNPARKSPRWSATASESGERHSEHTSVSGWPCLLHSAKRSRKRSTSTHTLSQSRPTPSLSASSQPAARALPSEDRVRRSAARPLVWLYSGHSRPTSSSRVWRPGSRARYATSAIAFRVSTSICSPSCSMRGAPSNNTVVRDSTIPPDYAATDAISQRFACSGRFRNGRDR